MKHITYGDGPVYPIAILAKEAAFNANELENNYTLYCEANGISREDLVLCSLPYNSSGKAPVKFIKETLDTLLVALSDCTVQYIYCADANYFKVLTNQRKAETHLGYCLPCTIKGFEHFKVILGVNHRSILYNPANEPKLIQSLDTLITTVKGTHKVLGADVIHSANYPGTLPDIQKALGKLRHFPELTCDIETFSLSFDKAGIGTIGFSWSEHEGVAFACDYSPFDKPIDRMYGEYKHNPAVHSMLLDFFTSYTGNLVFHNATFDAKILIYNLWMKQNALDTGALLDGLAVLARAFDDTKIIAYLATNTTAGNKLSLKDLAHEFAGNWAQSDIKDIRKIPLPQLLKYNLIDCLSTAYVKKKYYPVMVAEKQESIYKTLMLPSQETLIQVELTGMPLNAEAVQLAKKELEAIVRRHMQVIERSQTVKVFNKLQQVKEMETANAKLKVKQHPLSAFAGVKLNPNSGTQLQGLLYELMQLPVLDKTDTGLPATGAKTLTKLVNHATDSEHIDLLNAIIGLSGAGKILSTFIPAFERAIDKGDGIVWLHGSFNLGGTVSGRLSSSDPNLQNIPSGSEYGKLIKGCFQAPSKWLFAGADFHSLEDYISALTTRDPNKLKVYLDGYDGHCLRAYSYFKDEMPDVYQATDEERCYKLTDGDKTYYVKSTDTLVMPDGTRMSAEAFNNQGHLQSIPA